MGLGVGVMGCGGRPCAGRVENKISLHHPGTQSFLGNIDTVFGPVNSPTPLSGGVNDVESISFHCIKVRKMESSVQLGLWMKGEKAYCTFKTSITVKRVFKTFKHNQLLRERERSNVLFVRDSLLRGISQACRDCRPVVLFVLLLLYKSQA